MDKPWSNVATYFVVACAPAVVFRCAIAGLERLAGPRRAPDRVDPGPAPRSIEQLAADLHRLDHDVAVLRTSDLPAKSVRLRGLILAYDDTLREACTALDVPLPDRPPLANAVRLHAELALAARGLIW